MSEKTKKRIDVMIKIILVIIIILLFIRNCTLSRENEEYQNNHLPSGNVDIIEIKCDLSGCKTVFKQVESLSFSQKNVSLKKGETISLIVNVKPVELTGSKFTWESSNPSIATVDENGVVTGINTGTVTITVTSANGKKATCTVTVVKDGVNVNNIKLNPDKSSIEAGSMTQINAVIEPANATNRDLVWTSSDPSIATVNNQGVVKGLKPGTVTITAKTKDGKVVGKTTITVNPKATPTEIENLSFAQNNVSVKKDETTKLIVTVTPSELSSSKLTWTSSDPSVATVDENGVVKGIKLGTVTITVISDNGKKATCTVTVTEDTVDVKEIILTPTESTINPGDTTQVVAEIKPENATNRDLVWTSSDSTIATVDENGVVKGKKVGTVTITAKTKDGKVVASVTLTIKEIDEGDFEVYDQELTPVEWNGSSDLNIFTKTAHVMEGRIAPESANTYQFVIKNSTIYKLRYQISFVENNEYNINMKYKLRKNDTYIIDHYVSASELNVSDILLDINENDTYYLDWKWISSSNDTSIGQNPEAKYGLKIEVKAESVNE